MSKQDNVLESTIVNKSEFQVFRDYLQNVITTIMDVDEDDLRIAMNSESNEKSLAKFLINPQEMILLVTHSIDQETSKTSLSASLSIN